MANGKVEKKFRAGAVTATVWANKRKIGKKTFVLQSVSLQRAYQDEDGEWQYTSSLGVNDLAKAALVLGKAYEFMVCPVAEEQEEESIVEEEVEVGLSPARGASASLPRGEIQLAFEGVRLEGHYSIESDSF